MSVPFWMQIQTYMVPGERYTVRQLVNRTGWGRRRVVDAVDNAFVHRWVERSYTSGVEVREYWLA